MSKLIKQKNLVLLPGFGYSQNIFSKMANTLSTKFKVFCTDLPKLPSLSNDLTEDALSLPAHNLFEEHIEVLLKRVPSSAIWLGWSLGGLWSLFAARYFPDRVSALFLIATTPKFVSVPSWPGISSSDFDNFMHAFKNDPKEAQKNFVALQALGLDREKFYQRLLVNSIIETPFSFKELLIQLWLLKKADLREAFNELVCPIHCILGENDKIVPIAIVQQLKKNPNAKINIIQGATHIPFLSHEETFYKILFDSLKVV